MKFMHQAGFPSATYSQSSAPDCNLQRLLVASVKQYPEPSRRTGLPSNGLEAMVYKTANGVEIEADVYLPQSLPASSMPVGK